MAPFTKDTIANRDAIQRSCFPTFDVLNASQVLFCASDVAKALGYANPYAAVKRHCRAPLTKRYVVYGKTQYRALTKRYTPWRYVPF